jgi:hypothetical protein
VLVPLAASAASSCQGTAPSVAQLETAPSVDVRTAAYASLRDRLDTFHVAGGVKTSDGLLLPETIRIEIRSEVCVESREPGARFWSLDYDTCFVFAAVDTVDDDGEYSVSVPCLDADRDYQSRFAFGDLRLVQKGPVSFLAESDAGWRHQETFTSSRTQRRDLVLTLEPETFWVIRDGAECRDRPRSDANRLSGHDFGTSVEVVRFHGGWAQILIGGRLGWMEMRFLGTQQEMEDARPFRGKADVEQLDGS